MEPEPDYVEDEEGVLCPKCLLANSPLAPFCTDCGAPIGMVSAIDPIQHIYAEGFAYRSAAEGPPKFIILIGMWLIFLPAVAGLPLVVILNRYAGYGAGTLYIQTFFLLMGVASAVVLYRVTSNYVVKSRALRDAGNDELNHEGHEEHEDEYEGE